MCEGFLVFFSWGSFEWRSTTRSPPANWFDSQLLCAHFPRIERWWTETSFPSYSSKGARFTKFTFIKFTDLWGSLGGYLPSWDCPFGRRNIPLLILQGRKSCWRRIGFYTRKTQFKCFYVLRFSHFVNGYYGGSCHFYIGRCLYGIRDGLTSLVLLFTLVLSLVVVVRSLIFAFSFLFPLVLI